MLFLKPQHRGYGHGFSDALAAKLSLHTDVIKTCIPAVMAAQDASDYLTRLLGNNAGGRVPFYKSFHALIGVVDRSYSEAAYGHPQRFHTVIIRDRHWAYYNVFVHISVFPLLICAFIIHKIKSYVKDSGGKFGQLKNY